MKNIFLLLATSLVLAFSCVKNPVTGESEMRLISENQERQIGNQAYKTATQAQGGPFTADPSLTLYVQAVGQKLAHESARPNLSYEFIIVNDSTPNAWTLPGGKIAINRGLLTELQSEAELAAVLGHEIVHAAARHGAKGIERGLLLQGGIMALGVATQKKQYNDVLVETSSVAAALIQTSYSRGQELESDRYGMIYMAKAGYDPQAAVSLQELFLKLSKGKTPWLEGLFATHPPSEERIKANQKTAQELATGQAYFEGKEAYKEATSLIMAQKAAYASYDEGVKALEEKSYGKAYQLSTSAISHFEQEALFWNLKGKALLAQRRTEEALTAFSEAIHRNPDYFEFYLKRAECKSLLGDDAGARRDAKKSVELLPTGEGHELLGRLFLQSGMRPQALTHFKIASKAASPAGIRARHYLQKLSYPKSVK